MKSNGEKRRIINYVVDVILLFAIILLIVTGIIKYPPIQQLLSINPANMPYLEISTIHDLSGLVMLFFGIVHILLHLPWLRKTTKSIAKRGPRIIIVVLVLVFVCTAVVSIAYLSWNDENEKAVEDRQLESVSEEILRIETVGDFSFEPAEISTMRGDLFDDEQFSIFDIAVYLDRTGVIDMKYHFNETIDSYVIDSINGIKGWWYKVNGGEAYLNEGIFIDRFAYDDQYTYELVSIEENELYDIYGKSDEVVQEDVDDEIIALAEDTIRQLVEGGISDETIEELSGAGFKRELIDLLKAASQVTIPTYEDGVYTGVANGHNGDISVEVTIHEGRILYIEVTNHKETAPYLEEVFRSIPFTILKKQTTSDVDTVSGATESSKGLLAAIDVALSKAVK